MAAQAWVLIRVDATGTEALTWQIGPLLLAVSVAWLAFRRSPYLPEAIAIVAIAFSLRALLGIFMYTEVLSGRGFGGLFVKDDRYFFDVGSQLAEHWRLGSTPPIVDIATQPGHVYLHAVVIAVLGADPRNVAVVGALIGAATALVLVPVASPFLPGRWALVPAVLFSILPHQLYLAGSNQRDVVITFLIVCVAAILLVVQRRRPGPGEVVRASISIVALGALVAFWRLPSALMLALLVVAWVVLAAPTPRSRWLPMLALMGVMLVTLGFLAPDDAISQGPAELFANIDQAYGEQIGTAETFGIFGGERGAARLMFLPVTLPLSLVFGFVPYRGAANSDFNSLGFLYLWYPLLLPMAIGALPLIRRWGREGVVIWGGALLFLLLSAASFYGLVPRFRASAEPLLLVIVGIGLFRSRHLLPVYVPAILVLCICVNVLVWDPPLLPVLGAGIAASIAAVSLALGAQAMLRSRGVRAPPRS
ncbi:MAG: hypothetical protein WEA10_01125 [Actinomycetota bacterium]